MLYEGPCSHVAVPLDTLASSSAQPSSLLITRLGSNLLVDQVGYFIVSSDVWMRIVGVNGHDIRTSAFEYWTREVDPNGWTV